MRARSAIAANKAASAARRKKIEKGTLARPTRGRAGQQVNLLQKFIVMGADDPEAAAWMSAHAQARKQNFFRWCRRLEQFSKEISDNVER